MFVKENKAGLKSNTKLIVANTQPAISSSKVTIESLVQGVKHVQS